MKDSFLEVYEDVRVLMTRLKMNDWEKLVPVALEDKNLLAYSPSEIHTEEKLKKYVEVALGGYRHNIRFPYLIYDKEKDMVAGSTSFGNYYPIHKRVEIGWTWIGRSFQGSGLNAHMKYTMLRHAFDTLKLNRVEFKIDERNIASRKAVEKIGGQFEGILKKHTVMPDGFLRNTCYYGIISDDWEKIKQEKFQQVILRNEKK